MRIEQNTISRDWTVLHNGRTFYVNFTQSDGQTLALCNRANWEIAEETDEGVGEANACELRNSRRREKRRAKQDAAITDSLIDFCIAKWDNGFMRQLTEDMAG
jgi:hypothetical protein